MSQPFNIQNDTVVITKLDLAEITGGFSANGPVNLNNDVSVSGTLTADTINVKHLITESGNVAEVGRWTVNTEAELNGKGFRWAWGDGMANLMYRNGKRLWTDADFDLDAHRSFKINNTEVLSLTHLGPQVTKSNLKEVGSLKTLNVVGNATLGEFAFFNSGFGRLGLNTDSPNGTLSIVDNNVELVLGSTNSGNAQLGTYSNDDLEIITDNTSRIVIKNDGNIVIGNAVSKTGSLTVYGTITVDTLVADTRIERTSPLEFKATRDSSIHGKGLIWTGTGATRQFVMMPNPDRLWSTDSVDLAVGKSYYIDNKIVLSGDKLGDNVTQSKLTSLGTLDSLTVRGTTKLLGHVELGVDTINLKTAIFSDDVSYLNITSSGLNASDRVYVNIGTEEVIYADANEITIGNKNNTRKPVKIYGPVSVGVTNPDPDVDLTVKGNISFADKKFLTGSGIPTEGNYSKGDVCWNDNPRGDSYIGWVCVVSGTPGNWLPFGAISRQ